MTAAGEIVLGVFRAIEQRDAEAFASLVHPDLEIVWPSSLPYGNAPDEAPRTDVLSWAETWDPLQPTEKERRMDPVVIADAQDVAVVLWRQRGIDAAGNRFNGQVLGMYELRDEQLIFAQMFYFDTVAVAEFLSRAARAGARANRVS